MTLEIDVLTLFPGMIASPLGDSIPARIQASSSGETDSTHGHCDRHQNESDKDFREHDQDLAASNFGRQRFNG